MPTPNETYKQYGQQPFYYVNGLGISNNATTPNTKIDIAAGTVLDSTATYQMVSTASITIDAATNGLNGLDTGSFAASKVYAIYLISDPVSAQVTGAMLSLSLTQPLMPFGYSAFALIGFAVSDSSVHFLPGYWTAADSSRRTFMFDAPQATAVTAGASATYAAVDLTKWVPSIDDTPVWINTSFLPAAASRVLNMQVADGTGDQIVITGQVAAVVVTTQSYLFSSLASSVQKINYKVSNADSNVAVNIAGYEFNI